MPILYLTVREIIIIVCLHVHAYETQRGNPNILSSDARLQFVFQFILLEHLNIT